MYSTFFKVLILKTIIIANKINVIIPNNIIFIAGPVWNSSISLPLKSFLKNNDFKDKILIPIFTYSGGANRNKIIEEIITLTNIKNVKKPLFMFENGIFLQKEQIINWLNKLQ